MSTNALAPYKRLTVKIGSATIVDGGTGRVRTEWLAALAADLAALKAQGVSVVVVSSGAIALGRGLLGLNALNLTLEQQQAAASAGQIALSQAWAEHLGRHGIVTGQILITPNITEERRYFLNARTTITTLLGLGAIPIINENDSVATQEIRYGDNDRLSARVATMIEADCLILLSDIDGLYTAPPARDPAAKHIPFVPAITAEIEDMAGGAASHLSRGGMTTKIEAGKIATQAGTAMIIAKGTELHPLKALTEGGVHTLFAPAGSRAQARKRWIMGHLDLAGQIYVDAGAAKALMDGRSLLPIGVTRVKGEFVRGDAVAILDPEGREIARGLVGLDREEADLVKGKNSKRTAELLGLGARSELVHRDNMVVLMGLRGKDHMNAMDSDVKAMMAAIGQRARKAASILRYASTDAKNSALTAAAEALLANASGILRDNEADIGAAKERGISDAFLDRLTLTQKRIESTAQGLLDIAALPDPIGTVMANWDRPNGLDISRVRTPLGVVGVIFESRPNVTADAGALTLKAGNAVILRGGSDSTRTSRAIHACLVQGLEAAGLPLDAIQLVPTTDRAAAGEMLAGLDGNIDVIVPRGGKSLVARVQDEARVPVFAHLEGLCHTYVDKSASLVMAINVTVNAKMRRTGVCGATETLLLHKDVVATHLKPILDALVARRCEIRGDTTVVKLFPEAKAATEEDWHTEYEDAIVSVKVVDDVGQAIAHIEHYGSHHTEAIISEDAASVQRFFTEIDSAILLHNASTQFADGGEFGFGGEIGIATGKFHARGPVGLEQLCSFKYQVRGSGQTRP